MDLKGFEAFYNECSHPLIYNGDLLTVEDIQTISERFPRLAGIMIGRGLLANPALALEYQQGHPLSEKDMQESTSDCSMLTYLPSMAIFWKGETNNY